MSRPTTITTIESLRRSVFVFSFTVLIVSNSVFCQLSSGSSLPSVGSVIHGGGVGPDGAALGAIADEAAGSLLNYVNPCGK